jgi:hypothetical protein
MEVLATTAKSLGLTVTKLTNGGSFSFALQISNEHKCLLLAPQKTGFYPDTPRWFHIAAGSQIIANQLLRSLGYQTILSRSFDM